jgi:hypothetical protein
MEPKSSEVVGAIALALVLMACVVLLVLGALPA